ncbi:TIR domain-containing protein [Frankia sp. AgB1.9]|uniref:KGGVGR-motif variant AAA ATPase n=1 Tax=unclassified Frankia TaxID=2632575 RepID=UPI001933AB3D|nr:MULTISPECIES: TIR domain-containing protein [unclassified Frankia]MBL7492344.1 TIR domain-containing protein [Frankia sp. AgW1.1]MBL7547001.1 TIR domain-containing protein [Frankia sp. AgB1.9]MBL7622290.1 TIR domain-containing protein [Frankia sp. AgB1.8]
MELDLDEEPSLDEEPADENGRIVTFYSFKGGVGRTMSLAHVAWILASSGYKVLVVDWDLEAPGLAEYLFPLVRRDSQLHRGVVELVKRYADAAESYLLTRAAPESTPPAAEDRRSARRGLISTLPAEQKAAWLSIFHEANLADLTTFRANYTTRTGSGGVQIDFMPAGMSDAFSYSQDLYGIDWKYIRDHLGGDGFLNALRAEMKRHYNFVLIDSRTGMTESALVTTTWLADAVALLFSSNSQNIERTTNIAGWIRGLSANIPREIDILPVPSRLETGNLAALERFRRQYESAFREYTDPGPAFSRPEYWRKVPVMYDQDFSYFESPPSRQPSQVLDSLQFLAGVIAQHRDVKLAAPPGWDDFLARFRQQPPVAYDIVVISYAKSDENYADWIRWLLREHGIGVLFHPADAHNEVELQRQLRAEDGKIGDEAGPSWCVLPLLSPGYLNSEFGARVWSWARRQPRGKDDRTVLSPVLISEITNGMVFRIPSPTRGASDSSEVISTKGVPYVYLVGKEREAARNAILAAVGARHDPDGTYTELISERELAHQPEPPYPSSTPWSDQERPSDGYSAERFWWLLTQAAKSPANRADDLRNARMIGEKRGDVLASALAKFRQVTWVSSQAVSDINDLAADAADETLRLAEIDLPLLGGNVRGGPVEPALRISAFDSGRRTLRSLVDAIQDARQTAGIRAKLAEAAVRRSQGAYELAGNLCRDAHFDASAEKSAERSRCDLELALLSLHAGTAQLDRDRLDPLKARFQRVRDQTQDPEILFLAFLYEGVANASAGKIVTSAPRSAADCYEKALVALGPAPLMDASAAAEDMQRRRRRTYWSRHSLVLTYMAELGRTAEVWADSLTVGGFDKADPDSHFAAALAHVADFWPLCSLPLAYALVNGSKEPGVEPGAHRARILAALWIYTSYGRAGRQPAGGNVLIKHCFDRARELDANPSVDDSLLPLPDAAQVARALDHYESSA